MNLDSSLEDIIKNFDEKNNLESYIRELSGETEIMFKLKESQSSQTLNISNFMGFTNLQKMVDNFYPQRKYYEQILYLDLLSFKEIIDNKKVQWLYSTNKDQRGVTSAKQIKNIIGMQLCPFHIYAQSSNVDYDNFRILIEELSNQAYYSQSGKFHFDTLPNKTPSILNLTYNMIPSNNGWFWFRSPIQIFDTITVVFKDQNGVKNFSDIVRTDSNLDTVSTNDILNVYATDPVAVEIKNIDLGNGATDRVIIRGFTTDQPTTDKNIIDKINTQYGHLITPNFTYVDAAIDLIGVDGTGLVGTPILSNMIMYNVGAESFVLPIRFICIE